MVLILLQAKAATTLTLKQSGSVTEVLLGNGFILEAGVCCYSEWRNILTHTCGKWALSNALLRASALYSTLLPCVQVATLQYVLKYTSSPSGQL